VSVPSFEISDGSGAGDDKFWSDSPNYWSKHVLFCLLLPTIWYLSRVYFFFWWNIRLRLFVLWKMMIEMDIDNETYLFLEPSNANVFLSRDRWTWILFFVPLVSWIFNDERNIISCASFKWECVICTWYIIILCWWI
jgi:hypothetical protein